MDKDEALKLIVDHEINISKANELKVQIKQLSKELSKTTAKIKNYHKSYLNAKLFLKNRQAYIAHLENKYPNLKYISGYKLTHRDENRRFKVWVQDRNNKIRFWIYSTDLRRPTFNSNVLRKNKSHILKADLKIFYQLNQQKKIKPILFYPCRTCGKVFESKWGKTFCSDQCKRKWANRSREKKRSARTKRAKSNGKYDSSITLEKLFKRDKGECYICGKKLNPDTYYNDPLAPTIEHVIPIIKGGTHTWDNVRLACRACNNAKGTKLSQEYIDKAS